MKLLRKLTVIFLMVGLIAGTCTTQALADEPDPIPCTWTDLHMDATGLMSWKLELPEEYSDLVVQKYTISMDIMTTGIWRENYKTFVSTENRKEINYGLVGIYRFRVKAAFIGGFVSEFSDYSNNCTVTSDYINQGGGTSGGSTGGPGTTTGTSTAAPVGPGYPGSGVPAWVEKTGQWFNNNGGWSYVNNGQIYRNKWACIYNPYAKNGQRNYDWFCFDGNGIMRTGWYTDEAGFTYYLNPNSDGSAGKMMTGWQTIGGYTYYFDEKEGTGHMGAMARKTTVGGHVLDENGRMIR